MHLKRFEYNFNSVESFTFLFWVKHLRKGITHDVALQTLCYNRIQHLSINSHNYCNNEYILQLPTDFTFVTSDPVLE